jgi:stearoyl-CoA desaturase (delta-9 desaturase)
MFTGLLDLPWWGYVLATLGLTHITIAAVTIYLHRHSAHRALDLHPIVSHFFRFWLWATTGMTTKAWTAIHRKHHAKCETVEDPHSPQIFGLKKVLFSGAELYRFEGANKETLEHYGQGTPDDWMENHVYGKHDRVGIGSMLVVDVLLFGPIGITIWAVQMVWIPLLAAGVINGVGHFWGYRNFQSEDASNNVIPWGILIGGEELHNNHHAYASSAKLSNRWYEFDIGWMYIRILEALGLAAVKKIAPTPRLVAVKPVCEQTLRAVIDNRYDVLARYAASLKRIYADEIERLRQWSPKDAEALKSLKRALLRMQQLSEAERARLAEVLKNSGALATVVGMRQELVALWERSSTSKDELVRQLQDWCRRAESSGIAPLAEFSLRLRRYA